jgi:uncharacterized protein (DUF58 family)
MGSAGSPPAVSGTARSLAEVMRQVRRMELRTRGLVATAFAGEYPSVFKGHGMEFAEVREYVPGDDVRSIDWNVSARMGTPYVKRFVEERELDVLLLVDVSASQRWGSGPTRKDELIPELAANVAMSAARSQDRVGMLAWSDRQEAFVPPGKGRRRALRIVRDLLVLEPSGRGTDLAAALVRAGRLLRTRSVLLLVSDFRVPEAQWDVFAGAAAATAARHDLVAVTLGDPLEGGLPRAGVLRIEDPESGERVDLDTGSRRVRARYRAAAGERRERLDALLRRLGVDEVRLDTGSPVGPALLAFARRRERRLRQ